MRILRLVRIATVATRFGLDDILLSHERLRVLRPWVNRLLFWRDLREPARCGYGWRSRRSDRSS
jgi:ubiquinone biosynthesis protein